MLATLLGAPDPALAQTVREDFFITNGTVNAQVVADGTLYLGGSFTHVGPVTGAAAPIDPGSGAALPGFPNVSGRVNAICADGAGGWFIGGAFSSVGGLPRANLARIRPDFSVAGWDPGTNGNVRAIAVQGSTVYVAGDFTSTGGQTRNRIAAIDTTSALATAWDPNASNAVFTLAVDAGVVYAGGQFTTIGGQPRNRIASLDAGTGLATPWNPNANSQVSALAVDGSTVYAAGGFTTIGSASRNRLAALDAGTGVATAWNPDANDQVLALAVTPGTIYAGGAFTMLGGQSRGRIAAIDATTGVPTPWNPNAGAQVLALAVDAGIVYAGGDFLTIGGQPRSRLAALDAATGAATAWNPVAYGSVLAITATGPVIFAGGTFTGMGGVVRNNLAAFDIATGTPTPWDPSADDEVSALLARDGTLFAGGRFSFVGGQARANLAALDGAGSALPAWNPGTNGPVTALAAMDTVIYAGGLFTSVGGAPRQNIAALGAAAGLVGSWNPGANDQVLALVEHDGTVYAGGQFTTLGGQPRNRIGAVDAISGAAKSWNPNANGTVRALDASCGTIYAGGFFSMIGGQVRSGAAALSASSGLATAWNPSANGPLFSVAVRGPVVYVGGIFSTVGFQTRLRLAALSLSTGMATSWNPSSNGVIRSLTVDGNSVYAAGTFSMMGSTSQTNVAAISADTSITCPPIALAPATMEEGRSGTPYAQLLSASGGVAPYCFAVTAGELPPGLALDPVSGAIDGTPATEGTFAFTATATDAAGCQGTRAYSILIRPACPAIAILPDTLPDGRAQESYAQTLMAPAATPPLAWSVSAGALPDGLTLTAGTGELSGTPTSDGSFSFTVDVLDSNLCTASRAYELTIQVACPAIAIAPAVIPDGTVGVAYQRTLSAPLGTPPLTWTLASGGLPPGITLDAGSGTLSGTPTATGRFTFEVLATDADLCDAGRGYTVTMFDSLPASSVAAGTAGLSISTGNPCVTVPVLLTRGESAPLRALSVMVQLDTARLALCTPQAPGSSIRPGPWLDGFVTAFQVTDNGGGSYTVDQTILGLPCGQTEGGELFTLDLAAIGEDGPATIAVEAVHARDCGNQPVAVGAGPDGMLVVCNTPLAVTPAALPDGSVGTPYQQTLAAGSGTPPFTWSVSSGTLPDGITLDSGSGELSGTPILAQSRTFAVDVVDANGCSGSRSHTITIFAEPPVSSVAADASGLCLSTVHPTVSVPVVFQRAEAAPVRAVSVTLQLDAALALSTPSSPASSILPGPWLAGFTTSFQIIDHGAGVYTIDQVILGAPCGATDGGEMFTVSVQPAGGDGTGTITILAAKARDCANQPVAVAEGPPAGLPIQRTLPAPITDLAATPVANGNGANPTVGVTLEWSAGPGHTVALYRAPFGAYPIYDRDGPVAPPDPALAPGGPWQFVADSVVSGYVDSAPRGFWYYVAFATDSCGNASAVSNATGGTLDYLLGDVSNGAVAGVGDNRVWTEDVSLLGAHYGISGGAIETAGVTYLDVGPTLDGQPTSRPTPDHAIDFEDLMIFAPNFGTGATVPRAVATGQALALSGSDAFSVSSRPARAGGDTVEARIRLNGSGLLRGFSLTLTWDSTVVAPVATRSGGWIEDMGGVLLVPRPGAIDAALLGPLGTGMTGEGEVATVRFRALRAGDPRIGVEAVRGRDDRNRVVLVLVDASPSSPPAATRLDAIAPNPGRGSTTVWFSLARDGAVDLSVFGVDGRRVRRLIGEPCAAGIHAVPWDGCDDAGGRAAPGVYYIRLEAPGATFTRKLVLVR